MAAAGEHDKQKNPDRPPDKGGRDLKVWIRVSVELASLWLDWPGNDDEPLTLLVKGLVSAFVLWSR